MKEVWMAAVVATIQSVCLTGTPQAQVFTPTFASPRLINDVGLYLSDGPGNLAIEGVLRRGMFGLRIGYLDTADGLASVGGEFRNPIPVVEAPLNLTFTAAVQGVIGSQSAVGIQAGVSLGSTLVRPGVALTPYLHPRLGLLNEIGDDSVSARALADIGLDAEFWNGIVVRFGITLSDIGSNWGVGAAVRR